MTLIPLIILLVLLLPIAYAWGFEDGRREAQIDAAEMEQELRERLD